MDAAAIFLKRPVFSSHMDIALLCDPGCEAYASQEAKRLLSKEAEPGRGYVIIRGCSPDEIALLSYRSQTAGRILALIAAGAVADPDDLLAQKGLLLCFDYAPFLPPGGTFRVTCDRHGEHDWQAREAEELLGALLHEEKGFPVDLNAPAMGLWCRVVDDAYVIGIDLSGRDLGKREYRAFHTRRSLRCTVAFSALAAAGFTGRERLVDPFTTDGSIVIEAGLLATGTPVQKYRKEFAFLTMPFANGRDWDAFFAGTEAASGQGAVTGFSPQVRVLKMARGNAKLAGVEKAVALTKVEVNWLDTKFDEKSIDCVVTVPPASGKNTPLKDVEKLQDDLFYQSRFVLKPKGKLLLVTEKKAEFLNAAQRHGFALLTENQVRMGGTTLLFLAFGKGKK